LRNLTTQPEWQKKKVASLRPSIIFNGFGDHTNIVRQFSVGSKRTPQRVSIRISASVASVGHRRSIQIFHHRRKPVVNYQNKLQIDLATVQSAWQGLNKLVPLKPELLGSNSARLLWLDTSLRQSI
jgi:hypothetical protein